MILSRACEYGLRAVIYLASLKENGYVSIRTISNELERSFPFLTKIFQKLTQAGLMDSFRGPSGGVTFTRSPAEITLRDVVIAIDGPELVHGCVLGLPGCGEQKPCPLHDRWSEVRGSIDQLFKETTLVDMAEDIKSFDMRLKDLTYKV